MNERMKLNWKGALQKYLPERIFGALEKLDDGFSEKAEEIRLRLARPVMVYTCEGGRRVGANGKPEETGLIVNEEDLDSVYRAVTGKSPYAFEDDLKQGFITLDCGIRVGLAGSAVISGGGIKTYRSINGINFRIPTEAPGISAKLLPYISEGGRLKNTLIVSAPRLGKTTLARDIARSAGSGRGIVPCKVTLVDERQELAAGIYGRALFDVGLETDVISGVPKHLGVFMALRSLSPDVIVTDEIGKSEDLEALREVANAGVVMISTAHAPDLKSLLNRLFFVKVFDERLFDAYVSLSASLGRVTVEQIFDGAGRALLGSPFLL